MPANLSCRSIWMKKTKTATQVITWHPFNDDIGGGSIKLSDLEKRRQHARKKGPATEDEKRSSPRITLTFQPFYELINVVIHTSTFIVATRRTTSSVTLCAR